MFIFSKFKFQISNTNNFINVCVTAGATTLAPTPLMFRQKKINNNE